MTVLAENTTKSACWSCGAENNADAQFCTNCGKLQANAAGNYFSFFGLPRRFMLDRAALEKQFYQLSRKLHPDLYARASAQEQQWSLEKSSVLNDAWRKLHPDLYARASAQEQQWSLEKSSVLNDAWRTL